jgi:hypothetical protein
MIENKHPIQQELPAFSVRELEARQEPRPKLLPTFALSHSHTASAGCKSIGNAFIASPKEKFCGGV